MKPSELAVAMLAVKGAGFTAGFVEVAVAHCEGSLSVGPPTNTGDPLKSKHGALKVGSTIPNRSFSVKNVCSYTAPALTLWMPFT